MIPLVIIVMMKAIWVIIWYRRASCHIMLCYVVSYHIISYTILYHHIIHYINILYHTLTYMIWWLVLDEKKWRRSSQIITELKLSSFSIYFCIQNIANINNSMNWFYFLQSLNQIRFDQIRSDQIIIPSILKKIM